MPTTISGNTGVSQVQADATQDSLPLYGCRAWVNFDGTKDTTGATSTANTNRLILGSGNVTSVLRNAAGNFTVTFTTAMPDANFAITASCSGSANTNVNGLETGTATTSSITVFTNNQGGALDLSAVSVAIFR